MEDLYLDVKLVTTQGYVGVEYKGRFIKMDESRTFAYRVCSNMQALDELEIFMSIQEAIAYVDGLRSE